VVLDLESYTKSEKGGPNFFGPDLFLKTHFCEKKMCCFWTKIAQIFLFFCKSAIFDQKPARFFQVVTKANY
jgi:hypothetical protein